MKKEEFGDFEETEIIPKQEENLEQEQNITRLKLPNHKKNEIIGIVAQRLGGNRMEIKTTDGKTRNCRVPGRFKRKFWLRPGDAVIITPWEFDDTKGDIIYQYKKGQNIQLKKQGLLEGIDESF